MLTLVTGLPGSGKTLLTIGMVQELAEKEKRQVYYDGIPDCSVPGWLPLVDPLKWYELPVGSIILIDECQRYWRPRSSNSAVPKHAAELETHRHRGYDIFLMTQQPRMVDPHVRSLCGRHLHLQRKFGLEQSMVWEWPDCKDPPLSYQKLAQSRLYTFQRDLYKFYKSADLHTVRRKVPLRVFMAIAMIVLVPLSVVAGGVYWFKNSFQSVTDGPKSVSKALSSDRKGLPLPESSYGSVGAVVMPKPAVEALSPLESFIRDREPLVESLPHTAPRYASLTQAVAAPTPEYCLASADRCVCYTHQITRIPMDPALCRSFAEGRNFRDWLPPIRYAGQTGSASAPASDRHGSGER